MATQLDQELIRRMLDAQANPVKPFDPTKITSAVGAGLDLANTVQTRKQAQEDRVKNLAKEIEKAKQDKTQQGRVRAFAATPSNPMIRAEAFPDKEAEFQYKLAETKARPIRENRPFALQPKGRLKTGELVSFDPNTNESLIEGGKPYDPKIHGEAQPIVAPSLDAGQMKDLSGLRDSVSQLQNVKKNYKSSFTGPVESRLIGLYNATGINLTNVDPTDATRFRIGATTALNDYIRQTTGAQLSVNEERRITAAMASVKGPDETFIPAIDEAIRIAEAKLNGRFADYEAAGYRNVGALRESRSTPPLPGNPGQSGGLTPEKAARLAELRAKKANGTLR